MKLIFLPLGLMMLLAFLSVAYVSQITSSADVVNNTQVAYGGSGFNLNGIGVENITSGWYDSGGRLICDDSFNIVPSVTESGYVHQGSTYGIQNVQIVEYYNWTGHYRLTHAGSSGAPNKFDLTLMFATGNNFIVLLITGVAIFAALGFNILATGLNIIGTKFVGTFVLFGALWAGLATIGSVPLLGGTIGSHSIDALPWGLGWMLFFVLTFMYAIGVSQVASGMVV